MSNAVLNVSFWDAVLLDFCYFHKQESLSEHNIPPMAIDASRRLVTVQRQLLQRVQPLLTDRESLFQTCQPVSSRLAEKLLLSSYKFHSGFGCSDPVQVGII